MGTTLTGTTPQDTYDSLIKVTDNGPIGATAKYLSDGLGNDSKLALSTSNIGINTTSPSYQFDVNGDVRSQGNIRSNNGVVDTILSYTSEPAGVVGTITNHPTTIWANGAERMRITAAGNVGIGTSSPNHKLDVNGVVGGFQSGQTAYKTYSKLEGFQISAYQSVNGAPYTKTTDVVANADSGVASELRVLVAASGSNPAEVARFTSNGLTFNGDTAAANALDDYEEGTWTMGVSFGGASVGVTTLVNTGTYTKIGRQVTVNGYLVLTSKGSSTGTAKITGLPFTIAFSDSNYSSATLRLDSVTFANQFQGYGVINTTTIDLEEITEAGTRTKLTDADFANNSSIMVSLTYFV
jgi:hypothetical protein